MKKLILTAGAASIIALVPGAASAQLLGGGGGLGGGIGGTLNSTIGSTIDTATRSVRGTVDSTVTGSAATDGEQSVDARGGSVSASRSANGSIAGSTASLADLPVPALGSMASGSANGQASGSGNANAQLVGTDAVTGTLAPVAGQARSAAGRAVGTARGLANSAPTPGVPSLGGASASGEGSGSGSASLMSTPLAVAGTAAAAGSGAASVAPGMPVMTTEGASLGEVRQVIADSRGQVQQVVVQQGRVTRTLPAGMFSASGGALFAGNAEGAAEAGNEPADRPQPVSENTN